MNYITIDGHTDDFNVKFATIPQTQLNSENFCVILSYVWEIYTKPIKLHNEIGGLISSIQNKYPKVKIIVIFNSWYKDDIQEELLQPAKIVYIDYFLYRSYVKIVLEKKSKISNNWNNLATKFLFLTGKPEKINRIRLLYKLIKTKLLPDKCIWSLFYSKTTNVAPFLPELTNTEIHNLLISYNNNPDDQRILATKNNNYQIYIDNGGMTYDAELFSSTKFRVISESRFDDLKNPWITEKTWITILNSQPFIMAGSANTLTKLKRMGFKTFDEYLKIPNYDSIIDSEERLDAIVENTVYWSDHINKFSNEIQEDITHNLNNYYRLVEKKYVRA